jgi:hypothetical protein
VNRPEVIAVQAEVVRRFLVDGLFEAAVRHLDDEPSEAAAHALGRAHELAPPEASPELASRLARAGFAARAAERERFERAREPAPWLDELLEQRLEEADGAGEAIAAVASGLAGREPLARPDPKDPDAASWRVPGPGGHVRHFLALRALEAESAKESRLKRCWMYGFFVRACDDALAPDET